MEQHLKFMAFTDLLTTCDETTAQMVQETLTAEFLHTRVDGSILLVSKQVVQQVLRTVETQGVKQLLAQLKRGNYTHVGFE